MSVERRPLTNTIRSVGLDCPRKMYHQVERGLKRRIRSDAIYIGQAFHKGIEAKSVEAAVACFDEAYPRDQTEADDLAIKQATVAAMVQGALAHWRHEWQDARAELQFELPIRNPDTGHISRSYYLAGKIDEIVQDHAGAWWLQEYKTSGTTPDRSYIDRLYLDSQITTYFHAAQKVLGVKLKGVTYRIARKPSIRRRQSETVFQFIDRLTNDYMERPEFYFFEESLYRSQADLADFERELWAVTQQFLFQRRLGVWPKNTSKCGDFGGCQYIPFCTNQIDAMDLYEQVGMTPELEEGTDGDHAAD